MSNIKAQSYLHTGIDFRAQGNPQMPRKYFRNIV